MALYNNFKLSNSQLTNTRVNKGRNDAVISSVAYLQKKNDAVLDKKDAIDSLLEDVPALEEDKPALKEVRNMIKESLSNITDSQYVGDFDRQVNKTSAKTAKVIKEFATNYEAQQKYVEEAKKAGLSDGDIKRHLELSKVNGGLKFDKQSGDFSNRFSGYGIAEPVDQKLVREAIATMKPSKYTFDDGNGNTIEKETFAVVSPEEAKAFIEKNKGKITANDEREILASVANHQNLEGYYRTSPEFQKRQQFERDYARLQGMKLDPSKLDDATKGRLGEIQKAYATKDEQGNVVYPSAKEAYAKYLADSADKEGFGQVLQFAKLRTQDDEKATWSERSKFNAMTDREKMMESIRHKHSQEDIYLRDALDRAKKKEEDEAMVINDASSVIKNPNIDSNEDGTIKEQGFFSNMGKRFINYITPTGLIGNNKNGKPFSKEEIEAKYSSTVGEYAHNIMMRDSKTYKENQAIIDNPKTSKEVKEKLEKEQQQWLLANESKVGKEMSLNTGYQVPLTKSISEKSRKVYDNLIEQTVGNNLAGWGRSYRARKINEDGTVTDVTDFGTLLDKESEIDMSGKEFKKALSSKDGIISFDGERGSDGDLGRGMQVSIRNPENGKVERYAIEIPQSERAYKGKNGTILTEREAIKAKQSVRYSDGAKTVEAYPKSSGTHYKVYDKAGKLVDTFNIDNAGRELK